MALVYLAGLINPVAPNTITWRGQAADLLELRGIDVIDPLRMEPVTEESWRTDGMTSGRVTPKAIFNRSYRDARRCDLVLANLNQYNSKRAPFGTLFEIAWAYHAGIPVVAFATTGDPNWRVVQHPFVMEIADVFRTLIEAVEGIEFYA